MKLMGEFPKKFLEGGGEGLSFSLYYSIVGETEYGEKFPLFADVINE